MIRVKPAILLLLAGLLLGSGLGWLVLGSVLLGDTAASSPEDGSGLAEPVPGAPAPDFTLKTLDGSQLSLSQFRGQPVLINIWASWCPPCRLEMPELVRAYEAHQSEGFIILAIDLTFQDAIPDVEAFVDEFNMTFPVLLDETGEVTMGLYRLRGLPTSVFVGRDGRIKRVHIGAMTGEQIEAFVAEIMG
jgi:thiol-disulfide isomerase/thioredoxin